MQTLDRTREPGDGLGDQGRGQGRSLLATLVGGGRQEFQTTLEVVMQAQQTVVTDGAVTPLFSDQVHLTLAELF
jgi:hypothetical protein